MFLRKINAAVKTVLFVKNFWLIFLDYWQVLPSKVVRLDLRNNTSFYARTNSSDLETIAATNFIHECPLWILKKLPQGSTVIDLGAHIGSWAILLANMRPDMTIVAIEPVPQNYEFLVKNIKINHMEKQIIPVNVAVSNYNGTCYLGDLGATDAFYVDHEKAAEKSIKCEASKLSTILKKHNIKPESVKFIKMNIEGEEYTIIDDILPIVAHCTALFMEYHIVINNVVKFPEGDKILAKKMGSVGLKIINQTEHSLLFEKK